MSKITMLDIAKRTGNDAVVGLIDEAVQAAPEFMTLPVRPIGGTSYKTLVRTGYGSGGGFRDANAGVALTKGTYDQRLVECYIFDAQMQIDEALVKADPQLLVDEGQGAVNASFINLGKQFYSGTTQDAKGFQGFKQLADSSMLIDAGGTTATTETAWCVVEGTQGVHIPMGRNAALELGEWEKQRIQDDDNNWLTALVNNLCAWIGLQVGHKYAVGAVHSLNTTKPLTDALGAEMISKFPVGMRPTRWFMSRTAAFLLQQSRSAVGQVSSGATGIGFAPLPTELAGVPITVTDSIDQLNHTAW